MQVKGTELRSASILVESEGNETYDINAVINFSGNIISSYENGEVRRVSDNMTVASWNRYSDGNTSVNYMTGDNTEMCSITDHINRFVESVNSSKSLTENISL